MSRYCSFCGGRDSDVGHLITGPRGVAICNEGVKLAHQFGGTVALASTTEFLLTGISRLVTNDPRHGGITGTIGNAALVVRGGHVTWDGKENDTPSDYRGSPPAAGSGWAPRAGPSPARQSAGRLRRPRAGHRVGCGHRRPSRAPQR